MNDKWSPREVIHRDYSSHPPAYAPGYKTSVLRSPKNALISLQNSLSEITGRFSATTIWALWITILSSTTPKKACRLASESSSTAMSATALAADEKYPGGSLAGQCRRRYRHKKDQYLAPIDPNFGGCGRVLTDDNGYYCFRTIKPGPYPWRNQASDWRPAHIHFSLSGAPGRSA